MNLAVIALAFVSALSGHFALQGGAPRIVSEMRVTPLAGGRAHFDLWQSANGKVVRGYDVDMTKRIHVIVIADDFSAFEHLHPMLRPDGHFVLDATVPTRAYHIFAATTPHGIGQQVFRFDVGAGGARTASAASATVAAGPYTVALDATALRAGAESRLGVTIRRGSRLATDLEPYLGAAGHAVFIGASDLSYTHVHPLVLDGAKAESTSGMDMSSMTTTAIAGPRLELRVELRRPGTYRLWFEFRGGSRIYVAPFVVKAV